MRNPIIFVLKIKYTSRELLNFTKIDYSKNFHQYGFNYKMWKIITSICSFFLYVRLFDTSKPQFKQTQKLLFYTRITFLFIYLNVIIVNFCITSPPIKCSFYYFIFRSQYTNTLPTILYNWKHEYWRFFCLFQYLFILKWHLHTFFFYFK